MSKPTIDEQIAHERDVFELHAQIHGEADPMMAAKIASLEELKRIQSAEMPEPVAWRFKIGGQWFTGSTYEGCKDVIEKANLSGYIQPLYGPELLDYAQRKDAEAREQRERADKESKRADAWVKAARDLSRELGMTDDESDGSIRDWQHIRSKLQMRKERAESLAQENAALIAENEGLRKDGGLNMHDPEGQKYAGFPNDDALAAFKEQS